MENQADKSIIQKVKEILQVSEDLSAIEYLKLLKDYRKRIHPDKFTEKKAQEEATEKFKELGNTIEELNRYIENEKLHRGAKELALFEPLYDNVSLQSKLDEAEEEINKLKEKVDSLKKANEELNESLSRKQNKELEEENLRLKELYKPSNQKLASLGIIFLLTSAFAVMTKIEEVSIVLKKYSPFPEIYLNNVVFGIFVIMLLLVVKQFVENKFFALKVSEVCSPKFSKEFWSHLSSVKDWEEKRTKDFAEEDVFYFIHGKDSNIKRILGIFGFKLFQVETNDRLKNFVINTFLNKKLIEISLAKGLARTFTIKEGKRHYYWDKD